MWRELSVCAAAKGFFFEPVTNPALEAIDIAALAEVAHRHGVPVIVDVSRFSWLTHTKFHLKLTMLCSVSEHDRCWRVPDPPVRPRGPPSTPDQPSPHSLTPPLASTSYPRAPTSLCTLRPSGSPEMAPTLAGWSSRPASSRSRPIPASPSSIRSSRASLARS